MMLLFIAENSALLGTKPISYLNLDLATPIGHRPATMSLQDVQLLFYEVIKK